MSYATASAPMTAFRRAFLAAAVCLLGLPAGLASASVLSSTATALQPGHFASMSTGLTAANLQPDNTSGSLLDWADSGVWDPVQHQFKYIGKEAGCALHYRNIVYDEGSNTWSYGTLPLDVGCGHGYDQNTGDPLTGIHYFRPYSSSKIYKSNGAGWTTLPDLPDPTVIVAGLAKSRTGLLYSDQIWDVYYNDATGAKVQIDTRVAYPGLPSLGDYHSIAEYDPVHDVFMIGGGNGSRAIYRVSIVSGSPVRTRMNDAPFDFGVGETDQHTNITADPVTGEFIVYRKLNGTFYGYNIITDTWRTLGTSGNGSMPPLPTGTATSPIAAAVTNYGVIMYVCQPTINTAAVYLYKHAPAGPPDTVKPDAPQALIAR